MSAVVGEWAGTALNILTSPPIQAVANLIQVGAPLWLVIRAAVRSGRKVLVQKAAAAPLAASSLSEHLATKRETPFAALEGAKVWGPMSAEPVVGFNNDWFVNDTASAPEAYLTAIAIPWRGGRVRTYWYIISDAGELCALWWTQTFADRVPSFLRPDGAA